MLILVGTGIHKKGDTSFSELLKEFKKDLDEEVGAIASFIGIVRKKAKVGNSVEKLHYESAENVEEELKNIETEIEEDVQGISKICIHHIIDDLEPGDDIIYVLVGGNHRQEVFEVLPSIMDRVKNEVRIWKKEITEDEEYWIHELEE